MENRPSGVSSSVPLLPEPLSRERCRSTIVWSAAVVGKSGRSNHVRAVVFASRPADRWYYPRMALIVCVECDGKVSSSASACPHCGAPPFPESKKMVAPTVRPSHNFVPERARMFFKGWREDVRGLIFHIYDHDDNLDLWWMARYGLVGAVTFVCRDFPENSNFLVRLLCGAVAGVTLLFAVILLGWLFYLVARISLETPVSLLCRNGRWQMPEWPRKAAFGFGLLPFVFWLLVFSCVGIWYFGKIVFDLFEIVFALFKFVSQIWR